MTGEWYVERYAEDGTSAESSDSYTDFDQAYEAVKQIKEAGKTARFLAPAGTPKEQLDAFHQLGIVSRI